MWIMLQIAVLFLRFIYVSTDDFDLTLDESFGHVA